LYSTNGTLLTTITNPIPSAGESFGTALSTIGDSQILISDTSYLGAVYVFDTNGVVLYTLTNSGSAGDSFGCAVAALDANKIVVGAKDYFQSRGIAYLYTSSAYTPGLVADALRPGAVTTDSLANNAVDNSKIADGSISASKIASGQVVFSLNDLRDDVIIAAGTNIVLTTNGQILTVSASSCDAAGTNAWTLNGNNVSPGQFLGSTNNAAVEMMAYGSRALRIEPNTNSAPNIIGGSENNFVGNGVMGAFIGGGGAVDFNGVAYTNSVGAVFGVVAGGGGNSTLSKAYFSAIGGGLINTIGAETATIGGGAGNNIGEDSSRATIGGGNGNHINTNSSSSTISGGELNSIGNRADWSIIGGGQVNVVPDFGVFATIPGGRGNFATNFAFAAGNRAKANHTGAFVWADSQAADFPSTNTNEFAVRASGGGSAGHFRRGLDGGWSAHHRHRVTTLRHLHQRRCLCEYVKQLYRRGHRLDERQRCVAGWSVVLQLLATGRQ
jgi:hypothetical protein